MLKARFEFDDYKLYCVMILTENAQGTDLKQSVYQ